MSDRPKETDAPPAGEHIHMPASSLLPLLNAASLAGAIICITLSPFLLAACLIIFAITTGIWIRDSVRDVNELPLDHH